MIILYYRCGGQLKVEKFERDDFAESFMHGSTTVGHINMFYTKNSREQWHEHAYYYKSSQKTARKKYCRFLAVEEIPAEIKLLEMIGAHP